MISIGRVLSKDVDDTVVGITSQCDSCAYRILGTLECEAYPRGIPIAILVGAWDHTAEFPGDEGLRYIPRAPAP